MCVCVFSQKIRLDISFHNLNEVSGIILCEKWEKCNLYVVCSFHLESAKEVFRRDSFSMPHLACYHQNALKNSRIALCFFLYFSFFFHVILDKYWQLKCLVKWLHKPKQWLMLKWKFSVFHLYCRIFLNINLLTWIFSRSCRRAPRKKKGLFNPFSPVGQKPSPSEPGYILSLQTV